MSNLILSVPLPLSVAAQPLLLSSGALGLQPCLDPNPSDPDRTPSGLDRTVSALPAPDPVPLPGHVGPLPFSQIAAISPIAERPTFAPTAHCAVKGCVFPASAEGGAECHYHNLLRTEAVLFQSHQPSHLLLLQAPLGLPEEEIDDSREQDRKRLAAEREEFVLDEPLEQI